MPQVVSILEVVPWLQMQEFRLVARLAVALQQEQLLLSRAHEVLSVAVAVPQVHQV
jgi:hypothetical protein